MGKHTQDDRRALQEAAAWIAQLRRDSVSEAAIEDFFAWRRNPTNAAAYAEAESRLRQLDGLRDDPEVLRKTDAALRASAAAGRRNRLTSAALPVAAIAAVAAIVAVLVHVRPLTYATDVGVQQIVRLEDGSVVRLNTDSKVEVRLSRAERRLVLRRGEAFFEVARDAARPFVVEAGDVEVRALGTKFDVRRGPEATTVTLVEGRVQVDRASEAGSWTLAPNQRITLNGALAEPSPVDVSQATSWTTGQLRFRQTPLLDAVAEVNRYSRSKISLQASAVSDVRVNGVFDAGDTAAFVSAVTELFDLTAEQTPDGVELRARSGKGPAA